MEWCAQSCSPVRIEESNGLAAVLSPQRRPILRTLLVQTISHFRAAIFILPHSLVTPFTALLVVPILLLLRVIPRSSGKRTIPLWEKQSVALSSSEEDSLYTTKAEKL